jgi:alcohol dehydrogenase YqhD (iron-dependent ADH family)
MVYGMGSVRTSGVYEQVLNSLKESGVDIVELPGVKSNPLLSKAKEGIELARSKKVDVVLAVGGGSVIDTAKTIAAGARADHDPWEFFVYTKLVKEALPVLVVLTLSASASEMNAAAVITKDETCQKFSVRSPLIQPKTSILDPEVLFTLTPSYTAYSAVDIITHMLEGYFTNSETGESPLQDRMIYAFMRTLMEATEKSLANPKDYDARANFMWSGTLAFNGLTTAGMGVVGFPVHMIEHSLSALYDIAHGAGLSIMLPGWMAWSAKKTRRDSHGWQGNSSGLPRRTMPKPPRRALRNSRAGSAPSKAPCPSRKAASQKAISRRSPTTPFSLPKRGSSRTTRKK